MPSAGMRDSCLLGPRLVIGPLESVKQLNRGVPYCQWVIELRIGGRT